MRRKATMELFKNSITLLPKTMDGIKLDDPAEVKIKNCPANYNLNFGRLKYLCKKLSENPELRQKCNTIIKD